MTTTTTTQGFNNGVICSLEVLLQQKKISQLTYDKVIAAKKYIERKYNLIKLKKVEEIIINEKISSANMSEEAKKELIQELKKKETQRIQATRQKLTIFDYESLHIIGKGAFGEVHVCRNKKTGEVVAIKKIKKEVLLKKNQIKHTRDEQDFLSRIKSPWIVELKASFQQGDFLYLVMEFSQGGDFMNYMIKKDILTEDEARFYLAEIVLAIESIHKLNCIHRDIKPDNILIDKAGHLKLSDFGLSKIADNIGKEDLFDSNKRETNFGSRHNRNFSCVGTAYYVAPEVLEKKGYGREIDWWSLGIILFEMLYGYPPFASKKTPDVCYKVLNYKKYLKFPEDIIISAEAHDLIVRLLTDSPKRLGKKGAEEIKEHPFFKGINWLKVRDMKPPFIPKLKSDSDVSYFDCLESVDPFYPTNTMSKRKDPEFIGYTYKGEESDPIDLVTVIELIQDKEKEFQKNEMIRKEKEKKEREEREKKEREEKEKKEREEKSRKESEEKSKKESEEKTKKDPKIKIIVLPKFSDHSVNEKNGNSNSISTNSSTNNNTKANKPPVSPKQNHKGNEDRKVENSPRSPNPPKSNRFIRGLSSMKKSISTKIMRAFSRGKSRQKEKPNQN